MRYLALDIGEKRIGIATSESGMLATPHSVLYRKSKKEDFARLQHLIELLQIKEVIVGMPYSVSGPERMGPQARRVKRYAAALATAITVPIVFFDESYSTVDAASKLAVTGKKKTPIDAAAAAVILQNYIDSKHPPLSIS
jgi:putative Holliday junction resolvase